MAGISLPLGNGPRFIAYTHDPKGRGTVTYRDVAGAMTLTGLTTRADGRDLLVEAKYDGAFKNATWRISPDGQVKLNYTYAFDGLVDLLGVNFDFPEADMKGITYLGLRPVSRLAKPSCKAHGSMSGRTPTTTPFPARVYSFDPGVQRLLPRLALGHL